jgi:hypothetical protein
LVVGALEPGHDRDPQPLAGGPGTVTEESFCSSAKKFCARTNTNFLERN